MSMISAQVDKLRELATKCDELQAGAVRAVRVPLDIGSILREAADTIWDLRNKCADLVGERERLFRANVEKNNEMLRLARDNAKLRELARDMFDCISHANEQDWFYFERDESGCGMSCTVNGEDCGLCVLADRMRELGVEL